MTEVTILPGRDAASLDDWRPTFRDSIVVSSVKVELYNAPTFIRRIDFRRWDHYKKFILEQATKTQRRGSRDIDLLFL